MTGVGSRNEGTPAGHLEWQILSYTAELVKYSQAFQHFRTSFFLRFRLILWRMSMSSQLVFNGKGEEVDKPFIESPRLPLFVAYLFGIF